MSGVGRRFRDPNGPIHEKHAQNLDSGGRKAVSAPSITSTAESRVYSNFVVPWLFRVNGGERTSNAPLSGARN